jgi:hypothetical protein
MDVSIVPTIIQAIFRLHNIRVTSLKLDGVRRIKELRDVDALIMFHSCCASFERKQNQNLEDPQDQLIVDDGEIGGSVVQRKKGQEVNKRADIKRQLFKHKILHRPLY